MIKRTLILAGLGALSLSWAQAGIESSAGAAPTPKPTRNEASSTVRACEVAIPTYREALAANPNDATLHNRLGVCYHSLGDTGAARREYLRAVGLDARYAEAWNNLGTIYHARREYKKAAKQYRKAIQIRPELTAAHKNLGTVLLAMRKVEQGMAAYSEAYRLDPTAFENPATRVEAEGIAPATQYFYFAKLSARIGRVEAALDFLRRAEQAGFRDFDKVENDPDFKDIVVDARFVALTQ